MDTAKRLPFQSFFLSLVGLSGAMAVSLGAYASHGLKAHLQADSLEIVVTAINYQFIHTLALFLVVLIPKPSRFVSISAWLFIAGIFLFSVNLYLSQIFGFHFFGKLTPLGGIAFILGWLCLIPIAISSKDAT